MSRKTSGAFTLVEMLVVISIIAVIAGLAFPAISGAITRAQLTQSVNNARQLYLAAFQMASDGNTNSDPNLAWPGDATATSGSGTTATTAPITSLEQYANKLVQNDYVKSGDLQKLLNAPGTNCTVTPSTTSGTTTVTLAGKPALKVYKVKETDPSNTVFAATANYTYNTALDTTKAPYGDKGFVVIRKGGDASSYRRNQATQSNYSNNAQNFQAAIGKLPGDPDGTVSGETGKFLDPPTQ